jgi:hypothetical protein
MAQSETPPMFGTIEYFRIEYEAFSELLQNAEFWEDREQAYLTMQGLINCFLAIPYASRQDFLRIDIALAEFSRRAAFFRRWNKHTAEVFKC